MKLSKYLEQEVEKITGVKVDCKDLSAASSLLKTTLLAEGYFKNGHLDSSHIAKLTLLFDGILTLLLRSEDDKEAKLFFQAVEKLIFPPQMYRKKVSKRKAFVPNVEFLVSNFHSSPELVRAYELRQLMSELSFLIEPICGCRKPKGLSELLHSLATDRKMKDVSVSIANYSALICNCEKLKPDSKIKLGSRISREGALFEEAKQILSIFFKDNKKRTITWEGLAKKIYLERQYQTDSNTNLTERSLNRSLQKLKEFEKQFPEVVEHSLKLPVFQGDDLPYQFLTI